MTDNSLDTQGFEAEVLQEAENYGDYNGEEGLQQGQDEDNGVRDRHESTEEHSDDRQDTEGSSTEEEQVKKEQDLSYKYRAAMKEERRRRQDLQRQLEENAAKVQRMEQIFSQYQQQLGQGKQPQIPDYDEDPVGHIKAQQDALVKYYAEQERSRQEQAIFAAQQQKQAAAVSTVINDYAEDAREFADEVPEFKDAYKYLIENKTRQYVAAGYSENEANALVQEEELAVVARARQSGRNAAEVIYNIAREAGFSRKPQQPAGKSVEGLKNKVAASKSLGGMPGNSGSGVMTLEQLATLDGDEYLKAWDKMFK